MTQYHIWSEGYIATGEHVTATRMTDKPIEAGSFNEAVVKLKKGHPYESYFMFHVGRDFWSFWGCRLYPDEQQARAIYG